MKMLFSEQNDGWAGFNKEENLRRLCHRKKVRDRLFYAVVEDAKIVPAQAIDKICFAVGDNHPYVYAIHRHANFGRLLLWKCLSRRDCAKRRQSTEQQTGD